MIPPTNMTPDESKQSPRATAGKGGGPGWPSIRLSDLMPRGDVKGGARWIFGVGERQADADSGKGKGAPPKQR